MSKSRVSIYIADVIRELSYFLFQNYALKNYLPYVVSFTFKIFIIIYILYFKWK